MSRTFLFAFFTGTHACAFLAGLVLGLAAPGCGDGSFPLLPWMGGAPHVPVVVDAGREPTERDTSSAHAAEPEVIIEYRDRWHIQDDIPPECPETLEGDGTGVRRYYVPDSFGRFNIVRPRPLGLTPGVAVLTYTVPGGENAGQTVQQVFRVPEPRFHATLDLGLRSGLGGDVDALEGKAFRFETPHPFVEAEGGVRLWRLHASARAALDFTGAGEGGPLIEPTGTVSIRYRLARLVR